VYDVLRVAGAPMKRLILTSSSGGGGLMRSNRVDRVSYVSFRFVWDRLPFAEELASYLGPRSDRHRPGEHWSTFAGRRRADDARKHLSLLEFCESYDIIELWFDPSPNDQLQLVWLLDCFRPDPATAAKLRLRHVDFDLIGMGYDGPEEKDVIEDKITPADLELAGMAWRAYRAPTPERCVDLMQQDLSAFPLLRPALIDLLAELPSGTTGLGATEMRLLEIIANGYASANALFYRYTLRQTRVFKDMEIGSLLEGLAHVPRPAVSGLDDELRGISKDNHRDRLKAYQRSRLSLTEFGKAVLAYREDFSGHNPIDRWWGGTHLTNDNLWRWNPTLTKP
jgi:hypothetical protein